MSFILGQTQPFDFCLRHTYINHFIYMNKLTFFNILFFFTTLSYGQQTESVLFPSDGYRLTPFQTEKINVLLNEKDCEHCFVSLSGHTDSDASDDYNIALSQKRIRAVKDYLAKNHPCYSIKSEKAFGEQKPIEKNTEEKSKAKNRRVEITLLCNTIEQKKEPEERLTDVWPLISQHAKEPKVFTLDGSDGGTFNLSNGAKMYVAPNTFPSGQVNLNVSECNTIGDAFTYGLTTQSNRTGEGLQSQGMYKLRAFRNGRLLPNLKANDITIYIPIEAPDFQTFDAKQEGKYVTWNARETSKEKYIDPRAGLLRLMGGDIRNDNRIFQCNLFWCGIRSFFSRKYSATRYVDIYNYNLSSKDFTDLYEIYQKELNKEFESAKALSDFLVDNDYETVRAKMNELIPDFENTQFFAMAMPNYSWVNCDRFTGRKDLTTIEIDESFAPEKDMRLYFDKLFCVMGPNAGSSKSKKTKFSSIPIGELVTLVIIKKVNDVLMMSKEQFKVGEKPVIDFKTIKSQDLEETF